MITGIAYMLTAVLLAVVTIVGRTSGHEVHPGSEIFHYQSGLLKVLFFCSFLPLLVNLTIITVSVPSPSGGEVIAQMIFALSLTLALLCCHFYLKNYSVAIYVDKFIIFTVFNRKKIILFSSLSRINLLEGGRGEHVLCVLGEKNKELARFSESIGDFQILIELFKLLSKNCGIPFFYRDCYNNWSE